MVRKQWGLILFCLPLYGMSGAKLPQEIEQTSPLCTVPDHVLSTICENLHWFEIGWLRSTCKNLNRRAIVPGKKIKVSLFKRIDISPYIDSLPLFPQQPDEAFRKGFLTIQCVIAKKGNNPIYLELGCNNLGAYPELLSEFLAACCSSEIECHIRGLSLAGNFIIHLPPEIIGLKHLKHLSLEWNLIDQESLRLLAQMKSLRHLNLKNNELSILPLIALHPLGQMQSLRHLNVGLNDLSVLPEEISQLTNLKKLEINSNKLSLAAIKCLFPLKNLTDLDLSGNHQLSYRKFLELLRQKTWPLLKEVGLIAVDIKDEDYSIPRLEGINVFQ